MTQPAKAQEPTMEEILASIRRIIADDDTGKAPAKAVEAPPPPMAAPSVLPPPPPAPSPPPAPVAVAAPPPALPSEPDPLEARQAEIEAVLSNLNTPPPPVDSADDILELTESMAAPAPAFRTIDGQSDIEFDETPVPPVPPLAPARPTSAESLVSAATTAAVDSAFNTLAHTVLVQNARTLEDLVREMLRPMLKSWLDDNLPGLVERLVRAEIERVSRGRP